MLNDLIETELELFSIKKTNKQKKSFLKLTFCFKRANNDVGKTYSNS
jgi:hypothetical protein